MSCFVSQPPQQLIPYDSETNTIACSNHWLISVIAMMNLWGHWTLHCLKPNLTSSMRERER